MRNFFKHAQKLSHKKQFLKLCLALAKQGLSFAMTESYMPDFKDEEVRDVSLGLLNESMRILAHLVSKQKSLVFCRETLQVVKDEIEMLEDVKFLIELA